MSTQRAFLYVFAGLALAACGSTPQVKEPVVRDPSQMARVLVYPIQDARPEGRGREVDAEECRRQLDKSWYEEFLATRNSGLHWPNDEEKKHDISPDDLSTKNTEKLKAAKRGEGQYALFTFVRKFEVYGASLRYRAEAYLIDVNSGEVFWSNSFEDSTWLGILGGLSAGVLGPDRGTMCYSYGRTIGGAYSRIPQLRPR